ncbi:MAG: hypothetical protein HQ494_01710 [Rhodospirillales bacterium]|nr:hypothetical protein [Rhodospirillales bacterium]
MTKFAEAKGFVEVRYGKIPLTAPYDLSFATLSLIDVFYFVVRADGRMGIGEATPLPGYGGETVEAIKEQCHQMARSLEKGVAAFDLVDEFYGDTPMMASALACAIETWREGEEVAFSMPVGGPIPMLAPCSGRTPLAAARSTEKLVSDGYRTIKVKIGWATVDEDSDRIMAIVNSLPADGCIRIDANQGLQPDQALSLCKRLEGLPIEHLEQPFAPDQWEQFRKLADATSLSLMLDESIWRADDLRRAAQCGAKAVKLKLCKHRGMADVRDLVRQAERLGMAVGFGNGVQTSIGNHLEARLYTELGLQGASEGNGFLKILDPFGGETLQVQSGYLKDQGLGNLSSLTTWGEQIAHADCSNI